MNKSKSLLIVVLLVLVGLPVAELVREEFTYLLVSKRLKSAYKQIEGGMTKNQVRSLAGEPDSATTNDDGEVWHWDTRHYQGTLFKRLGITWVKGHYGLRVVFSEEGKTVQRWGGIN